MIIKKLIMHNFGVYANTNEFDFNGKKPVVLIGGMNGRGKTTFLEAVLIGLYGSKSFAYLESKYQTYGQYLRSYVNKSDGSLESYIDLEFAMGHASTEVYYVHREWNAKSRKVIEYINVKKNGEDNPFLTENWPMFVENILPSALSNFFFFDGEKIAELAVENTSAQMKESIKAMLGISVLDLLKSDLGRIISKISKKGSFDANLEKLEELRVAKVVALQNLAEVDEEIKEKENRILQLNQKLEYANNEYAVKGGDIVEQRQNLLMQKTESSIKSNQDFEMLLEVAAGALPLQLVGSLLDDVLEKGEREQAYRANKMAYDKLDDLLNTYISNKVKITNQLKEFISYIRDESQIDAEDELYGLSDVTLYQLKELRESGLKQIISDASELIVDRNKNQAKIDEVDNYLSVEIDENEINRIYKRIKALEMELATAEMELRALTGKRSNLHGNAINAESVFSKMAENVLSSMEADDSDNRIVKYAHMAMEIVSKYQIKLQSRKTDMLADTMTSCYKRLANKKNLIEKVIMDSDTLDFHYLNKDGDEVEKKSLSAGEKQLMVISLLWALAMCSKKKLPVIIDTPLSRLDSMHRKALVTIYFPNASDQTIILSTDSEIDEKYYNIMYKDVGDQFTLVYDDVTKSTSIKKGYFEMEDA